MPGWFVPPFYRGPGPRVLLVRRAPGGGILEPERGAVVAGTATPPAERRGPIQRLRNGRARPHGRTREALVRVAATFSRAKLVAIGEVPGKDALGDCAAYLAMKRPILP